MGDTESQGPDPHRDEHPEKALGSLHASKHIPGDCMHRPCMIANDERVVVIGPWLWDLCAGYQKVGWLTWYRHIPIGFLYIHEYSLFVLQNVKNDFGKSFRERFSAADGDRREAPGRRRDWGASRA